jgi:ankyrin repeat protein
VRGDTLLHAAVRDGDVALVRQLLDHGISVAAPNWAGLSARAGAQDAEIQALLDAAETATR